jgi:sulfane dehydrogenase subunit SoxC
MISCRKIHVNNNALLYSQNYRRFILKKEKNIISLERRRFFENGSKITAGSLLLSGLFSSLNAKESGALSVPQWSKSLGTPTSSKLYGMPSPFEKDVIKEIRLKGAPEGYVSSSIALTSANSPISKIRGGITPNGLFYERNHSGAPEIDPKEHKLLIHGLVDNSMVFTMDKIKRLPSIEKTYFVECSGNTHISEKSPKSKTLDDMYGLMSCATWVGVKLSTLLEEAGIYAKNAKYVIAEGADGATYARTVPMTRAMDDCMVAYMQNGEAIRPEQGYPLKLIVPGCEGSVNVKWLRRLEVTDTPLFARDEVSKYTDLLENGNARQGTLFMDVKSVITFPTTGDLLPEKGFYEIRGIAWSGRGKIKGVDVSLDGGKNWKTAKLSTDPLSKAFIEFTFPFNWDGKEAVLLSRAVDEGDIVQPYFEQISEARGFNSESHNNAIQAWLVNAKGEVHNVRV